MPCLMKDHREHYAQLIKREAALGFLSCGISKAGFLAEKRLSLSNGSIKTAMGKCTIWRITLKAIRPFLVPGAKSVVSLLLNYHTEEKQKDPCPKISSYAFGQDYHRLLRKN